MQIGVTVFAVGSIAGWRITHLLHAEDGPWDVLVRLRRLAGNGALGAMLDCFYCLSVWVAAPLAAALGSSWQDRLLLWPAISGAAILLERATEDRRKVVPAAEWREVPEELEGETT